MWAGRYQNSLLDKVVVVYNFFSFAVPLFIFALIALFIFGYRLAWFPTVVPLHRGQRHGWVLSRLYHLLLPAITSALLGTAVTIQYLRSEVIDSKSLDFVRTARSKGYQRIKSSHVTFSVMHRCRSHHKWATDHFIDRRFCGHWENLRLPRCGKLFIDSIVQRDYAVITSLTLILGLATLIGTLLSDIIMSIVDPRIRIQ